MEKTLKIIPFLLTLIFININPCLAQPKNPIEVVNLFNNLYGGPEMDTIADYTTPKFRDNKPKSVWVVDTWKILKKLKYERLNSSVIDSKVDNDKAIVVMDAKISTAATAATQKEVYYLVKEGDKWLIDDLIITDEELDLDQMKL